MDLNLLTTGLPADVDGAILMSEPARLFFSESNIAEGILLACRGGCIYLTDSRYIEQAQKTVGCCDVVELTDMSVQIPQYLGKFGARTVAIESSYVTIASLGKLTKALSPYGVRIVYDLRLERLMKRLRSVKNQVAYDSIKKAQTIAEAAYYNAIRFMSAGMTEKEVALALDFYMLRNGADAVSFETIVVSGKNSSKPHGVPTDKEIEFGDFVTMDFGAVINGFHSDMTRTVGIGEISDFQEEIYSTVLAAQEKAIEAAGPGVLCSAVDAAARGYISEAGYGEFFRHSTGHGVGLEIHEAPTVASKSNETLIHGNVITVEPGIYIPGKFGVRIEDMLYITGTGKENLTTVPKTLTVINN